jgi:Flp pilus assembly pilin Flp
MMKNLMSKLWNDDGGALIAAEYLFVATIVGIGVVVGLTGVRNAINAELTELGNAYLALSEGYIIKGVTGCGASVDGSQAIDTPGLLTPPVNTPPAIPSVIDVLPCS